MPDAYHFRGWSHPTSGAFYRTWAVCEDVEASGAKKGWELRDFGPVPRNSTYRRFGLWAAEESKWAKVSNSVLEAGCWLGMKPHEAKHILGTWPENAEAIAHLSFISRRLNERSSAEWELSNARAELKKLADDLKRYIAQRRRTDIEDGDEWKGEAEPETRQDTLPKPERYHAPESPDYMRIARMVLRNGPGRTEWQLVNGERKRMPVSAAPYCHVLVVNKDIPSINAAAGDVVLILHGNVSKPELAQIRGTVRRLPRSQYATLRAAWSSVGFAEASWAWAGDGKGEALEKLDRLVRLAASARAARWKDESSPVLIVRPWGVIGLSLNAASDEAAAASLILEVGCRPIGATVD